MREPAAPEFAAPAADCAEAAATCDTAEEGAGIPQPDKATRLDTAIEAAAPDAATRVRAKAFRMCCLSGLRWVSEQSSGIAAGLASDFAH
jgi:hypothetical protein